MKQSVKIIVGTLVVLGFISFFNFNIQAQMTAWCDKASSGRSKNIHEMDVTLHSGTRVDNVIFENAATLNILFGVSAPVFFSQDWDGRTVFSTDKLEDLMERGGISRNTQITGTVVINSENLKEAIAKDDGSGSAYSALLAHEYAHAMQVQYRYPFMDDKYRELHADYMAGWYLAYRTRTRFEIPYKAFKAIYKSGDNQPESDEHHGTSAERLIAAIAGYSDYWLNSRDKPFNAYSNGLNYVRNIGARSSWGW